MTAVFICLVLAFLWIGKIDKVEINKKIGRIRKSRTSCFCISWRSERQTDDLVTVGIFKKGEKIGAVDSLYF